MIISTLTTIKIALDILGALLGLKGCIDRETNRKRLKHENSFRLAGESVDKVYEILIKLLNDLEELDRVVVFRSHNGTGIPKPGRPLYSSVSYEVLTKNVSPIRRLWNSVPVDPLLAKSISAMIAGSVDSMKFNETEPCYLKTIAKANNELQSLTFYISSTENSLYYLAINSSSRDDMESDLMVLDKARSAALALSRLIK